MESLALLVAILLLALLLSSLIALIVTWRARTRRGHIIATVCGIPGLLVGLQLLTSVGSTGGRIFGLIGVLGFVLPVYRTFRFGRGTPEGNA